jgi:hypothetical protein
LAAPDATAHASAERALALADELTSLLRTPQGTMRLRPLQAIALEAMDRVGGLFCAAAVGVGKTLVSALAMTVVGGERPLILTSASIIQQTESDFAALRLHWRLPQFYRLEPYEKLGHPDYLNMLDELQPTCLILDEVHKLKHVGKSARAKRVARWREANPDVPVVCLSGSPGSAVEDYAHLLWWALRDAAAEILPGPPGSRELRAFCDALAEDDVAKEEFGAMLARTPGVVISPETYRDTPLEIHHTIVTPPAELEEYFAKLRDFGEAPDGWYLNGPAEVWLLARHLANGSYEEHIPRPDEDWLDARKEWYRFCRDLIDDPRAPGGPWDTEGQVAIACRAGKLDRSAYDRWMAVKDSYQPVEQTAWLSTFALEWAEDWGREHAPADTKRGGGAIIWVESIGFGEELAKRTGWPYYASGAVDQKGRLVKNATAPVIICSRKACGTGFNLQHRYSRNLFVTPPSGNGDAEQTIGRTHRSGQPQPVVYVEMLHTCIEDWGAIAKAQREARAYEIKLMTPQKLSLAQTTLHGEIPHASVHSAWRAKAELADVVVDD